MPALSYLFNPPLESAMARGGSFGQLDSFSGFGGFGLSNLLVGMTGEVERQRLDILERMKRTTDSRAQSRLTLPKLFGEGETKKNILADVL